jgi:paraquat-inducible protein A
MKQNIFILLLLILSITLFALGLYYPILSTKQSLFGLGLKYQELRLIDSVRLFYNSGDYLIAGIIFLFTMMLPIIKYLEILNKIFEFKKTSKKISTVLQALDKWSMLDVFLVALLLLNFKLDSNIIVMKLKLGVNFLAISIIVRMYTSFQIEKNEQIGRQLKC